MAMILLLAGCTGFSGSGNSYAEVAAIELVGKTVAPYFKSQPGGFVAEYWAGELDGGCAVLLSRIDQNELNGAFWVRDGHVYAVNDMAETMAPQLEAAPPEVTFARVKATVH